MEPRSDLQVLVTGCYRSGTEYLAQLLGNHPDLAMSMYVVSFLRFCHGRYDPVAEEGNWTRLVYEAAWRIRHRWGRRLDVDAVLEHVSRGEVTYARIYDAMMAELFLSGGGRAWGEKVQLVWRSIPAFLDMFPTGGRVVHLVRDPRNVLASWKRYTYAPPPSYLGAAFNALDSMRLGLDYRARLDPSRYRLVRFEDLLADPAGTMTGIFAFLGLDAGHDLLDETGWLDAHGEPWVHNSAFHGREGRDAAFDAGAALRRWERHLTPADTALCEAVCAGPMAELGYEPSGADVPWPQVVGSLMGDPKLEDYLRRWLVRGEGAEDFPTDPLQPGNWEENAVGGEGA